MIVVTAKRIAIVAARTTMGETRETIYHKRHMLGMNGEVRRSVMTSRSRDWLEEPKEGRRCLGDGQAGRQAGGSKCHISGSCRLTGF